MKKAVLNVSLGLAIVCFFASCLKDSDNSYVSYGVIQNTQSLQQSGMYEILTDLGNTLVVLKSHTVQEIVDGKRILVNFNLLSDKDKSRNIYEVEVNGFYHLLSKPLVSESFILQNEEHRRDSIGNDPLNAINAWLGGGYLNINFEAYFAPSSNAKHFINLIYDDTREDADTIYLTLRHNAYNEKPEKMHNLYRGVGRCSFKISDLQRLTGAPGRPYKLTWLQYTKNNESKEYSVTYSFKDKPESSASFEEPVSNAVYENQVEIE